MEPEDLDPPDPGLRWLRWAVVALLALGFAACIAKGANTAGDPGLVESRLPGFSEIAVRIQAAGAETSNEHCAVLALTEKQRARGLMEVTDLKGYVGMVFRFPRDSQGAFFMRNTPMPLSIAYFGADGQFVSSADMEPCADEPGCRLYGASAPYRYALEVAQGRLGELGIGPGSELVVAQACPGSGPPPAT